MDTLDTYEQYKKELNQEMNLLERAIDGLSGGNEHLDLIAKILLLQNKIIREGLSPVPPAGPGTILTPYKIVTLPLDTALVDHEIQIPGNYFTYTVDVSPEDIYVRVDNEANEAIPLSKFNYITIPFQRLFVTASAQSGKTLTLFIGDKSTRASGFGKTSTGTGGVPEVSISIGTNFVTGQQTVAAAGTPVQLSTTSVTIKGGTKVTILSKPSNAGVIYFANSEANCIAGTYFDGLDVGIAASIPAPGLDLSNIWIDAANAGDAVSYYAETEE